MSGRLLSWPIGLQAISREALSGPRTYNAGSTESVRGVVQSYASPYGLLRWRFTFPPLRGQLLRRYRGWVTALHGGANATRVPWCDWDGLSLAQRGITATRAEWKAGKPWSNGMPWSNGQNWKPSSPIVSVTGAASYGATEVQLGSAFWGQNLDMGDSLGFFPKHFGAYTVTERIAAGHYRVWPFIRAPITTASRATLHPTWVGRLESEEAATLSRGATFAEGLSVTLVEVLDADVRTWFVS